MASPTRLLTNPGSNTIRSWCVWLSVAAWFLNDCVIAKTEDDDEIAVAAERQFVITEQQFDQLVFGGQQVRVAAPVQVIQGAKGNQQIVVAVQPAASDFRGKMNAVAAVEIQAVHVCVSLTDSQQKKLKLAARGDIAKLFDRVAELRPKVTAKPMNQQEYVELMRELQPLRMNQQFGVIAEDSLFRKTLRRILTDEQRVLWQKLQRERQKTIIETALQNAERTEAGLKLKNETRTKIVELILDHGRLPQSVGPYGQYIVFLEANLLRDRVKPLLTDDEWKKFEWQVGQSKRLEPTLEAYGLWTARRPNDDDETIAVRKDDQPSDATKE